MRELRQPDKVEKQKDIEQLFRKEFESFDIQPSEKVWKKVRSDLFAKNFLHFSPWSVNIWYTGGVLILAGIITFSTFKTKATTVQNSLEISKIPAYENSESVAKTENSELSNPDEVKNNIARPEVQADISATNRSGSFPVKNHNDNDVYVYPEETSAKQTPEKIDSPVENSSSNLYNRQSLLAFFKCTSPIGCAPLSTRFLNYSQNAVRYYWSFGDGGNSELECPDYIFDEPGNWFVSLTAYSANNEVSVYTDSIRVNPLPVARFSMDALDISGEGIPVYFYNFSKGADKYMWDFGDGSTSDLKDPDHFFNTKTNTGIKLRVISESGCTDSTVLTEPFKEGEPVFIFPTAFSPSVSGPASGLYTRNNQNNDVFHPLVKELPVEYQLKIFNRRGILIFESNDVHVGWNGYYHEEIVPQGVYVWKARAKFEDGRSVVRMGDVTVLWD